MKILDILSETFRTERIEQHTNANKLRALYKERDVLKTAAREAMSGQRSEEAYDKLIDELEAVEIEIEYLEKGMTEAKNHMGDREYQTYNGWKAACKKAHPGCSFRGDKDIGAAVVGNKDVGEWDGAVGSVYAPTLKESDDTDHREMLRGLQKALDKAQSDLDEMEGDLRLMKNTARSEKEYDAVDDFKASVEKKRALVERLKKRVKLRKAALGGK